MDRLDIRYERHGRVTEAYVKLSPPTHPGFYGHGSALRSKKDVEFHDVGDNVALGRAFQDLGQQIEAIGQSKCVTKDEYGRVALLQYRREVTKNSAVAAIDEVVRANLLDPTEAKREHAAPSDGNPAPCRCDHPESHEPEFTKHALAKRERYCTQGCDD